MSITRDKPTVLADALVAVLGVFCESFSITIVPHPERESCFIAEFLPVDCSAWGLDMTLFEERDRIDLEFIVSDSLQVEMLLGDSKYPLNEANLYRTIYFCSLYYWRPNEDSY